jgi:hypothetical protein
MTVTPGSELREASEGLGGAWVIWTVGPKLEDMEILRGNDDDDFGDGDAERLRPSRSLECRPADGGLTNFEKKPGAILSPYMIVGVSSFIHHSHPAFSADSTRNCKRS